MKWLRLTSNCTGYEWMSGGGRILSTLMTMLAGCMIVGVDEGVEAIDMKRKKKVLN